MYYTVSQIGKYVTDIFNAEVMLHNILIFGEVSGFKISQNHAYFTIKDDKSALQCSCFNYKKTYVPKDGETVIIKCSPSFYQKGGRLSFIVDYIEPQGKGDLFLKIEQLKKQLFLEGLFDESKKKPIPQFCKKIGVVTSKTGAVIRDICSTARRKNKYLDILLVDTKVQGIGAVEDIIYGINVLDKLNLDAIIVARGGGSVEDLMPFNDEKLARAIFNAKTPIISAVGHETDYTICDMVADVRCLTPTAAGELVAFSSEDLLLNINSMLNLSITNIKHKKNVCNDELVNQIDELNYSIKDKFTVNKNLLEKQITLISSGINKKVLLKQNKYVVLNENVISFNRNINEKYAVKIYKNGIRQFDLDTVNQKDNIKIVSNKISLDAVVNDKKVNNGKE